MTVSERIQDRSNQRAAVLPANSQLSVVRGLLDSGKLWICNSLRRRRPCCYSEAESWKVSAPMRASVALIVLLTAFSVAPLAADARSDAKKHVDFGVMVAQKGLWREAILQWQRAAELDPTYAAAQNNLAIAYEHEGELDKARAAYEKALSIEPNNSYIKQNYELFKEINDRTTRKDAQ